MIGKLAGRYGRSAAKLLRKDATVPKVAEEKTRKSIRKEMVDLGTPAAVAGKKAPEAHTPPPQRKAGLTAGGESAGQRRGWKSKKRTLDRLDNELNATESKIDTLKLKSRKVKDRVAKMRITSQIQKLQAGLKRIKERMKLEVEGMKGMVERHGPAVQVKTGGTVKLARGRKVTTDKAKVSNFQNIQSGGGTEKWHIRQIYDILGPDYLTKAQYNKLKKQGYAQKTGGTIKRSTGGMIGMGAALRGGGAVRKR
jgi:hypothetical protein